MEIRFDSQGAGFLPLQGIALLPKPALNTVFHEPGFDSYLAIPVVS